MSKYRKCISITVILAMVIMISGCQTATKKFGGNMTIELPSGQKLETIDWEDDSLWYLTRAMEENEKPETHMLQQSSEFGIFEGTVTIVETKEK